MMHKVKNVVSKIFHPSFLLSGEDESDRSKRKRSDSTERTDDKEQVERAADVTRPNGNAVTTSAAEHRTTSIADELQLTDDEDNTSNSRDVPSAEQQTKRRRTATYQHIVSPNHRRENERTPPSSSFTDGEASSSPTTPILRRTSIEQSFTERINRLQTRLNMPLPYRRVGSDYDPSKSPLFSTANRSTATASQSSETPANHVLATSLLDRSTRATPTNAQPPSTLRNPVLNERRMLGAHYSSISSRRLPYIERLRRRTLQDSIRLDSTVDSGPLPPATTTASANSTAPTTTSVVPQSVKAAEKDCGVQCDIPVVGPTPKTQRTLPPADVRDEVLSTPPAEKISTASSISIERAQTTATTVPEPKVLGNITPFSWPKFARAQMDFASKFPDKCHVDAIVPSIAEPTARTTTVQPSPSRSVDSAWKCPCCTKENSAQTPTCTLCHGINPNYKKPSLTQSSVTVAREQAPSVVTTLASFLPTPVTSAANQAAATITLKTNPVSTSAPTNVTTTSAFSIASPAFATASFASASIVTKESLATAATTSSSPPMFGFTPFMSQPSTSTTTAATTKSFPTPTFGFSSAITSVPTTTTSAPSTIVPRFAFGTAAMTPLPTVTTTAATAPLSFGVTATTDSPISTSRQTSMETSSPPVNNSMIIGTSNPTSIAPLFPVFSPASSASPIVLPWEPPRSAAPIAFGSFGDKSFIPSTTSTSVVSTISSSVPLASTPANTSTIPKAFGTITNPPPFTSASILPLAIPTPTTSSLTAPSFGTAGFSFGSPSSTASFGITSGTPARPFASATIPAPFGSTPTFGTPIATPQFGSGSAFNPVPPSTNAPVAGFACSTSPSIPAFSFGITATSSAPSTNLFNFGISSTLSPTAPPFVFSAAAPSQPFGTSEPSTVADEGPVLFNIGSDDTRSSSPRRILRARRRDHP